MLKKINRANGKRDIYLFNKKIFSYKHKKIFHKNNDIRVDEKINCNLNIQGKDNIIEIGEQSLCEKININIHGENNKIIIESGCAIVNMNISIGNHFPINNSTIKIKSGCWVGGLSIVLESDSSEILIGKDCAISTDVFIRCGEYPHLVFDKDSGKYFGKKESLTIGDHVWLGAKSTILTHSSIPNGSIIGACSVVTKPFEEENVVIAGNPAKICKRNIYWAKDPANLDKDSIYYKSLMDNKDNNS